MRPSPNRVACEPCNPIASGHRTYDPRQTNRIEGIDRFCKPCIINKMDLSLIDTPKRLEIDVTH
jgi:hypothetical protein